MTFVELLHIAASIFLLGPLQFAISASPPLIRERREGLRALRLAQRTTRLYGAGSVTVFLLGLALIGLDDEHTFNEFWLSASMTLFVVALVLVFTIIERDQRTAITRIDGGQEAPVQAGRILATSAAVGVMWLVILALMLYRPGS